MLFSLNPARRRRRRLKLYPEKSFRPGVKSCQRWVMETGGIDPHAEVTDCVFVAHSTAAAFFFSCCARLAAPLSMCVSVCALQRESESERESCPRCRFLFIKYSHSHLYASAASLLSLCRSVQFSSLIPSLPRSRSLSSVYLPSIFSRGVDRHSAPSTYISGSLC